jgi:hypothetical protein
LFRSERVRARKSMRLEGAAARSMGTSLMEGSASRANRVAKGPARGWPHSAKGSGGPVVVANERAVPLGRSAQRDQKDQLRTPGGIATAANRRRQDPFGSCAGANQRPDSLGRRMDPLNSLGTRRRAIGREFWKNDWR